MRAQEKEFQLTVKFPSIKEKRENLKISQIEKNKSLPQKLETEGFQTSLEVELRVRRQMSKNSEVLQDLNFTLFSFIHTISKHLGAPFQGLQQGLNDRRTLPSGAFQSGRFSTQNKPHPAWMEGEFGGEWRHVYVWLTPFAAHPK